MAAARMPPAGPAPCLRAAGRGGTVPQPALIAGGARAHGEGGGGGGQGGGGLEGALARGRRLAGNKIRIEAARATAAVRADGVNLDDEILKTVFIYSCTGTYLTVFYKMNKDTDTAVERN
eukprot:SAG31_NODE_181_length_21114_cov_99.705211_18_plen_120_part_00